MQRRGGNGGRAAPPGVFETIALAMSALLVQPLPLVVPIAVDLYLAAGARLSPAPLLDPIRRFVAAQGGEAGSEGVEALNRLARTGDLTAGIAFFLPSLVVDGGAGAAALWDRPSVSLGGAASALALGVLLLLAGVWLGMALASMLVRVLRGRMPVGDRFLRASALAALRYLGFLALVAAAVVAVVVPVAIVGAVFAVAGVDVLSLLVAALIVPVVAAYVCLAFVGEAIVIAEVGPLRACSLSFGVVRRNLWPSVGLLAVLLIASLGLARLGGEMAGNPPGLVLAIVAYAFVATGLALARLRFFDDRLRRWRGDLVPPPMSTV
jgi:hypothetical protein